VPVAGCDGAICNERRTECGETMTLPDFLVIGAQRAGTTQLHRVLEAHPEVYVPYRRKEVHYFDWYFDRGVKWYEKFFPSATDAARYRAIGEVTPDYLFEEAVPQRIHQTLSDCRFVVSLRHPVDRAYSWYRFLVRRVAEQRSPERFFEESQEGLKRGLYSEQLSRYFEVFPSSSFLILIFEEILRDPTKNLERLAGFLDLSRGWPDPAALMREPVNTTDVPKFRAAFKRAQKLGQVFTRHDMDWVVRLARRTGIPRVLGTGSPAPDLPLSTRAWLQDYYREEIVRLEGLLRRDLGVWRRTATSAPSGRGSSSDVALGPHAED
jgi:hypothetical protein